VRATRARFRAASRKRRGAASLVERLQKGAPLGYRLDVDEFVDGQHFDAFGWDVLLFGQDVEATYQAPRSTRKSHLDQAARIRLLVNNAIGQAEALDLIERQPELLAQYLGSESWVTAFAAAMRQSTALGAT